MDPYERREAREMAAASTRAWMQAHASVAPEPTLWLRLVGGVALVLGTVLCLAWRRDRDGRA